jgi:hypothetical protein
MSLNNSDAETEKGDGLVIPEIVKLVAAEMKLKVVE